MIRKNLNSLFSWKYVNDFKLFRLANLLTRMSTAWSIWTIICDRPYIVATIQLYGYDLLVCSTFGFRSVLSSFSLLAEEGLFEHFSNE